MTEVIIGIVVLAIVIITVAVYCACSIAGTDDDLNEKYWR